MNDIYLYNLSKIPEEGASPQYLDLERQGRNKELLNKNREKSFLIFLLPIYQSYVGIILTRVRRSYRAAEVWPSLDKKERKVTGVNEGLMSHRLALRSSRLAH